MVRSVSSPAMVIFAIVMIVIALLAAVGFLLSNRPEPTEDLPPKELLNANENIVSYVAAEIPSILHDMLSFVPLATTEEAMMGCYSTMRSAAKADGGEVHPFRTESLDELLARATTVITCMEKEEHIAKFTVSTQKKSKTNPHVDLIAHGNDSKRTRLIRFWRTENGFIATLSD